MINAEFFILRNFRPSCFLGIKKQIGKSTVTSFRSMRSRWWFLALSACKEENIGNKSTGLHVEYELFMTNGDPNDILRYQFSDDEWLILPTDVVFLLLQCGLLTINYIIGCQLTIRRLYHNTYRISTQSMILDVLGLSLMVIAYGAYALDGIGFPFLKGFAQMFFIFMVLLLGRGQNVTKMKLTKILQGFDPALVYFQSESIPGFLLAGWRIVAWVFFFLCKRGRSSPEIFFPTQFVFRFWAGPIVLCIANYVLDNWVREGVVNIVDNGVISYGYIVFLYISWPSNANANFPFHIRTTQIDVSFNPNNAYVNYGGTHAITEDEPFKHQVYCQTNSVIKSLTVPYTRSSTC
ncbi:unnamed protein product [Angiostrongylus costaricensis]|uniref:GpcrRhopsn4 domain-containing protein n=1 Tax=Angiostrongylus costaricensis TaxID=334426 RepID=A0A0R3PW61_ANGCS|nr:unnamed protein product [Angiostrongylus costaricensis]